MNFDDFQKQAAETDQNPGMAQHIEPGSTPDPTRAEVIPLLGMVGEVGSLLGEYKKLLRDGETHRRFKDEVAEELGDILVTVHGGHGGRESRIISRRYNFRIDSGSRS